MRSIGDFAMLSSIYTRRFNVQIINRWYKKDKDLIAPNLFKKKTYKDPVVEVPPLPLL